jgi:tRNA threonylcarbamoyladenosine biosynthesis protein TsaE
MANEFQASNFNYQVSTDSVEDTKILGERVGLIVNSGLILALTGNLGSGKTSFVQGLARGLNVPENYYITSPTYTLINEYPGRHRLFHVDLYRIGDPTDFEDLGLYDIFATKGIVAIEWADRLANDLLTEYVAVEFEMSNRDSRNILLTAYGRDETNLLKKLRNMKHPNIS